jgi:hypothetical protein
MLLGKIAGLPRVGLRRATAPGRLRGFGTTPRRSSKKPGSSSDDAVPTIDTSLLRSQSSSDAPDFTDLSGSPDSSDRSGGRGGPSEPVDVELMSSLARRSLGAPSRLVTRFDDRLVGLNEAGVSPTAAMQLLELFKDKARLADFARGLQQDALELTDGYGRSVRLAVPFHQYQITSRMHDAGPHTNRWLLDSPSQVKMQELVGWFPAGGKLDGVATLGRSGIVLPSHYRDVDLGDIGASLCMMTTTDWHALDGFLMWMLVHYKPSRQFCYFAYGSGQHRMKSVDELNPILGGAMMSTMAKRLSVGLSQQFTPGGKTPKEIRDFIRKTDPALADRCELLELLDMTAVPIAAYRRLVGGNTVAVPKPDDSE